MSAEWYYTTNKQQMAPGPWKELRELAEVGILKPHDMVWSEGMDEWIKAINQSGLFADGEEAVSTSPAGKKKSSYSEPKPPPGRRTRRRDDEAEEEEEEDERTSKRKARKREEDGARGASACASRSASARSSVCSFWERASAAGSPISPGGAAAAGWAGGQRDSPPAISPRSNPRSNASPSPRANASSSRPPTLSASRIPTSISTSFAATPAARGSNRSPWTNAFRRNFLTAGSNSSSRRPTPTASSCSIEAPASPTRAS